MRATILTIGVMAVSGAQPKPEAPVSMPTDVANGRVAWFDITTNDLAQSKDFYGKLFDWTFAPVAGTDQAVEIVSGGSSIGTIRGADGQISSFNGVVYVQVKDVEESSRKAKELGANVAPGFPFNLPGGRGAIGLFGDPSGHPMGIYSKTPIPPRKPAGQ